MASAPAGGRSDPRPAPFLVRGATPRSTSGEVGGLSSRLGRVRLPHGVLDRFATGGDRVWERTRSPKPTALACGVRFLRHLLVGARQHGPAGQWSGRLPVKEKSGGSIPLGTALRKCVRRWLGACLLSRCTWVRFPPLPLYFGVPSSRSSRVPSFSVEGVR